MSKSLLIHIVEKIAKSEYLLQISNNIFVCEFRRFIQQFILSGLRSCMQPSQILFLSLCFQINLNFLLNIPKIVLLAILVSLEID